MGYITHEKEFGRPFIMPSKMYVELDEEQLKTLANYRDSLDERMIKNMDKQNTKLILFQESKEVTKFINKHKNK